MVAAGWKPGFSTDNDAVLLARRFSARTRSSTLEHREGVHRGPPDRPLGPAAGHGRVGGDSEDRRRGVDRRAGTRRSTPSAARAAARGAPAGRLRRRPRLREPRGDPRRAGPSWARRSARTTGRRARRGRARPSARGRRRTAAAAEVGQPRRVRHELLHVPVLDPQLLEHREDLSLLLDAQAPGQTAAASGLAGDRRVLRHQRQQRPARQVAAEPREHVAGGVEPPGQHEVTHDHAPGWSVAIRARAASLPPWRARRPQPVRGSRRRGRLPASALVERLQVGEEETRRAARGAARLRRVS